LPPDWVIKEVEVSNKEEFPMRFGKAVLMTLAVCTLMVAALPAAAADLHL
jgi:hypothetical protein